MKRKRGVIALIITAFIAVLLARPAGAVNVYFTAVNNILMPLSDNTMPTSYNGSMYIPYSVFNSTELKTYAVYSSSAQAVTIFGDGAQLIYNLRDGTTYDYLGIKYNYRAIYLNGRVYIPIAFTCRYFDIGYSTIYGNEYGTIIRFTNGDALDDETFSRSASVLMRSRLNDYLKAIESAEQPSPTPSTPTPTPTAPPVVSTSPAPEYSNVEVFLSFFGLDEELTPRILDALAARSYSACFFVSGDDISAMPDLIRRISGSGHTIGLICSGDTEESYSAASKLLFDAAHTSSFISALDSSAFEGDEDTGLVFYCSYDDAEALSVSAVRSQLIYAKRRADFIFLTDEAAADGLPAVLRTLNSGKYNVSRLTEAKAAAVYGG